jgi:predicted PhzF superfamily epimerase YddE/YHI9
MDTQCLTWLRGDHEAEVRCWSISGQQIRLCGHGLLCCGVAWLRSEAQVSQLFMGGLPVAFYAEDDLAWIGLPSLRCDACAVPHWVREFFRTPPWRAATAGGEDGYLILEWPAGFDLEDLPVPPYSLRHRTQRSLIVTCIDATDPEVDVRLRYFAPQHGVPEDSATGSAMRVLATYWRNRELNDGLRAYQCSHYGGELRSRIRGDLTWIGGRVLPLTRDARYEF